MARGRRGKGGYDGFVIASLCTIKPSTRTDFGADLGGIAPAPKPLPMLSTILRLPAVNAQSHRRSTRRLVSTLLAGFNCFSAF